MKPSDLQIAIDFHFANDEPLGILGAPGIGKSEIVAAAAKRHNLPLIIMNLVMSDPTDFKGLPFVLTLPDGSKVTEWVKQEEWLRKQPFALFLDEIFQAPVGTMNVAAPIILEKRIDNIYLPEGSRVVFASNRMEDRAGTNRVPSHIPNRCTIVELESSAEDWVHWAIEQGMPEELVSFMLMRPGLLHDFDANRLINATPRQWAAVGRMVARGLPHNIAFETIAGRVGEGPAAEFTAFVKIASQLPTREAILLDPERAPVPNDPSARWAVTGMLIQATTVNNFDSVAKYMTRMPEELQAVLVKEVLRLNPSVAGAKGYVQWAVKFAKVLQ